MTRIRRSRGGSCSSARYSAARRDSSSALEAAVLILLRHRNRESKVRFDQLLTRGFALGATPLLVAHDAGELLLVLRREHRHPAGFRDIQINEISVTKRTRDRRRSGRAT